MSSNPMQACVDMFLTPQSAFNSVLDKKGWAWLPFFLVTLMSSLVFVHYFSVVDIDWFQEQSIEQAAAMTGMSYQELKEATPPTDASSSMLQTVISVAIGLVIVNLFGALYFLLATKITAKNELSFGDWFAFAWWTSLPAVLSSMVSMLVIFFATDTFIAMADLQPTSFNSLFFGLPQSNVWSSFFEGISLFNFWMIALSYFGLKSWLAIESKKAFILAIIPSVIIYGCWALFIALLA